MFRRLWPSPLRPCDLLGPERGSVALDRDLAGHGLEDPGRSTSSGPERAGADLRAREIQIVLLLEAMVGKLVARRHADAPRASVGVDHVDADDLRLFAAVLREGRHTSGSPCARRIVPCPCKTIRARCPPAPPPAGLPPGPSGTSSCCRSVRSRLAPCIAWRSWALPRCVRPVPETRQRAGSTG